MREIAQGNPSAGLNAKESAAALAMRDAVETFYSDTGRNVSALEAVNREPLALIEYWSVDPDCDGEVFRSVWQDYRGNTDNDDDPLRVVTKAVLSGLPVKFEAFDFSVPFIMREREEEIAGLPLTTSAQSQKK